MNKKQAKIRAYQAVQDELKSVMKVASVACQHEVLNLALPSLANLDHFRDATKMIFRRVPCRFTNGGDCG